MRLLAVFMLSFLFASYSAGQGTDLLTSCENGNLQVRQRPGTDRLLEKWLAEAGIEEDTVYAYIFIPSSCPRCESGIKRYGKLFRSRGKKFVLISAYPDKKIAEFYNKKKGYTADYYIYDTNDRYKSIFSFNNIPLNSPDILKITKQGRLITGYDGMFITPKINEALLARTEPMAYKDFDVLAHAEDIVWKYPVEKGGLSEFGGSHHDYRLDVPDEYPLCEIFRNSYFSGNMFFYPDEILGTVSVFKCNNNDSVFSFSGSLGPTDEEKNMFVNVDSAMLKSLVADESLYYIVCNAAMLDTANIGLSFSLPKVFYEDTARLAFYNKACILPRRLPDFKADECVPLDFSLGDNYFYQHFQFSSTGNNLIMGCEKYTWASSFDDDKYKRDVRYNSFMPGFYDTETPFMAAFDRRTGKLVCRFGHLDDVARKTMTGYYYVAPLSAVGGNELAYTDSYSGKVYVADTSDVSVEKNCYTVFEIADEDIPPIDTTMFYNYGYAKPFRSVFCRQISDIRITPDKLYCMVTYGDTSSFSDSLTSYTFVTLDRKTGVRHEYLYPREEGWIVFTRGLREKDGCVYPFSVLKRDDEAILRVYGEDA